MNVIRLSKKSILQEYRKMFADENFFMFIKILDITIVLML